MYTISTFLTTEVAKLLPFRSPEKKEQSASLGRLGFPRFIFNLNSHSRVVVDNLSEVLCYLPKPESDRYTDTTPARYYERIFSFEEESSILSCLEKQGVLFEINQEFERVYTKYYPGCFCFRPGVAGSCMRYETCDFNASKIHPCEVYATNPKVKIGYLSFNGMTIARAILNEENMGHTKIYAGGDSDCDCNMNVWLLGKFLSIRGFSLNRTCLEGVEFDKIEVERHGRTKTLSPFFDDLDKVDVRGGKIIPKDIGDFTSEPEGVLSDEEETLGCCDDCGDPIYEDSEDRISVGNSIFCNWECASNYGWNSCERCGDYCHNDDSVCAGDSVYCGDNCARRSGFMTCDNCCEYVHEDDANCLDDGVYCDDCCIHCKSCNEHTLNDNLCETCKEKEDEEHEPEIEEEQKQGADCKQDEQPVVV